jgi:hypothetical protein
MGLLWRKWKYSKERVLKIVEDFKRREVPCSSYIGAWHFYHEGGSLVK